MLVKDLVALIKLAGRISNPSSLTNLFRSIELSKSTMRCISEFGNIEVSSSDTGLTKPCILDVKSISAVVTLPSNNEIIFKEMEENLEWRCGNAHGKWKYVVPDRNHKIPQITHDSFPWIPDENLPEALRLAGSACQAASVAAGLYGITVEVHGDKLYMISCNTVSLAASIIDKGLFPVQNVVLRPPVPEIIAGLVSQCKDAQLDVVNEGPEKGIFIKSSWLKAHLPLSTSLDLDLKPTYDKWTTKSEFKAKIDSVAIRKFINRARILSDKHTAFTIGIKISDGKLILTHSGISSSAEEYFIADGIDPSVNFSSIQEVENTEGIEEKKSEGVALPAELILMALTFVDEAIFDFLPENTLILRGSNPEFIYVVGGGK